MSVSRKLKTTVANVVETGSSHSADVRERIAVCAYYKAEARSFVPGSELDDWLAAEAEISGLDARR